MFVQLILATADQHGTLRARAERAAAVPGWLGSIVGVTPDGRTVAAFRFASRHDDAKATQAEELFTVLETEDVEEQRIGDFGNARFAQVMLARVADRSRFEAVEEEIGPAFVEHRPDFLAGYRLWFADGRFAALDYFSSIEEARAGEAKPLPDELAEGFAKWQSLVVDAEWYDVTDPWITEAVR